MPQALARSPGGRNKGGGRPVPPPPRYLPPLLLPRLADIFGNISHQLTVARAWVPAPRVGTSRPPGVADSSSGGGREKLTDPHPTGDGSRGDVAATCAARVGNAPPPPRGQSQGIRESPCPPPPHRRGRSGRGEKGWGSRGAPCRPCAMSTGPQHASHAGGTGGCGIAVAAITRGIPGCWGEDNGACRCRGGGYSNKRACCPPEGRRSCQAPSPGGRGETQQGRGRRRRPEAAHMARIRATGGLPSRAHSHLTASFRCAATYRGAGGGIGQASGRL